ncbi:MAG: HAD family hydrolase [Halobacteriaceae archaeon]
MSVADADRPEPADYDYWLFDLDGTLVDTEWAYKRELFDWVGTRLGRSFDDRQVELLWHGLGGDRDDLLAEWGVEPGEFWAVFDGLDDPRARAEATFLYDDARGVADVAAPVGIVTHCPEPATERVLDALGVRDWFDTVVCCTDDLGWKPDPAPVEAAVADLGLDPGGRDRGVLAGDGAGDVGAAYNAGLDAVHVERHDPRDRGHCVLGDRRVAALDALL